jgi:serine protease Do
VSTIKVKAKRLPARNTMLIRVLMAGMLVLGAVALSYQPLFAKGAPESFADLVEKLQPAVVNISTVQTVERRQNGRRRLPQAPEGTPFGDLWDQFRDRFEEQDEEPRQARSLGSGFIIDAEGYVVTNNHVIEGADEITVITNEGTEYEAELIGRDKLSDLALLKIENGGKFPSVKWGDSDAERVGDWLLAIGNPFGQQNSVSAGILSARNRQINRDAEVEFIQTDAAINKGNSGGPLFNMEGEVIGVNTAIFSPTGGSVGLGFSIPSNDASRLIAQIRENGRVVRGFLGVAIQSLNEEYAEDLGLSITEGALISEVNPDGPADKSGIQVQDVIVSWDGDEITTSDELVRAVRRTTVGKPVEVIVVRDGERKTLQVITGEREETDDDDDNPRDNDDEDDNDRGDRELVEGMELGRITSDIRRRFRIEDDVDGAVVLRVARRSQAARAAIRPGFVILRVNQSAIETPGDVAKAIEDARDRGRDRVLLLVNVRGRTAHVPLRLEKERDTEE